MVEEAPRRHGARHTGAVTTTNPQPPTRTAEVEDSGAPPTCFIAMPISVSDEVSARYGDDRHWEHVMECLFVPAIEDAGYVPIRPFSQGTAVIHDFIFEQLSTCNMVLGDFSSHNANVFYELGIRTALNLPMTLVLDEVTQRPFDLGTLNSYVYNSGLQHWGMAGQIRSLSEHIKISAETCRGENPLWYRFSLGAQAATALEDMSPTEARLRLLEDEIRSLDLRLSYTQGDFDIGAATRLPKVRGTVRVDLSAYRTSPIFLDVNGRTTVQELLDTIFNAISDHVRAYRYGEDWYLVNESGRPLISRGRGDVRPLLASWGIDPMETLAVKVGSTDFTKPA